MKKQHVVYLEEISHTTRAMPYAVYRSCFWAKDEEALYLHWHPEMEFCYLESGELDFMVEDIRYRIHAGEAVFVPPNLLHMAKPAAGGKETGQEPEHGLTGECQCAEVCVGTFRALVFSAELIASPAEPAAFRKYVQPVLHNPAGFCLRLTAKVPWQREALADLKRIFSQAEKEREAELLVAGLVRVIWQNLYLNHFKGVMGNRINARCEMRLQETVRFIHAHFQEEISLRELSRTAHLSEGQFCRSFKELTGNTPFTYLKRYRILKSCDYLAETDKKISEICMLCGFNNISYFNREFLKMMKVKPSVYRARRRKEEQNTVTKQVY